MVINPAAAVGRENHNTDMQAILQEFALEDVALLRNYCSGRSAEMSGILAAEILEDVAGDFLEDDFSRHSSQQR